jgi:archaetidylinositol phosphate synthase
VFDTILGRTPIVRRAQSHAATALFRLGVRPNIASAFGLATGVAAGLVFATNRPTWGVVLLLISATFDALDGTIARECSVPSVLGGILDLCSDRMVEIAVLIGITWQRPELQFPALVLAGSWYLNITVFLATGSAMERGEKLIAYPPGLVERTEAIVFFVILAAIRPLGPLLCYLYTALELVTAAQRAIFARRVLSGR